MADELKVSVRVTPDMSGFQPAVDAEAKRQLANHPIEIPADVKLNVAAIRETLEKWAKGFNGSITLPVELTQNLSDIKEAAVEIRNTLQKNIGSIDVDVNTDTAKKTIKKTIRKSSIRRPRHPSPEQEARQAEQANQKYYDKQTHGVVGRLQYAAQSGRNKLGTDEATKYVNDVLNPIQEELDRIKEQGTRVTEEQKANIANLVADARQALRTLQAEQAAAVKAANAEPKESDLVKRAEKLHKDLVTQKELVTNGERKLADASEYNEAWDKIEAKVEAIRSGNIVDPDEVTRTEAMAKNLEQVYKDLYAKEHPTEPKPSTRKTEDQKQEEEYIRNLGKIQKAEVNLAKTKTETSANVYKEEIAYLEKRNAELLESISNARAYNDEASKAKFVSDARAAATKGNIQSATMTDILTQSKQSANDAIEAALKLGGGYDVEKLKAVQDQLEKIGKTNTNVAAEEISQLNIAVKNLLDNLDKVKTEKAMPVSRTEVDALKASFEDLGRNWSKLFTDANLSGKYSEVLKKIDTSSTVAEFNEAKQAVKAFKAEVVAAGKNTVSWADRIGSAIKTLTRYWSINEIFMTLKQVMGQMVNQVVELDTKVTDLQIASGKSRNEVKAMVRDYAEMGKELGATATAMAEAADTFLRQGMSVAETNKLITDTMYLSKLGQIDAAEASTALTSSLNGYKLAAEDAIDVVDKLTAVDAVSASSAGGLAVSLAETATSARLAGVTFDQLIGYTATVKEVTQDADESVGTFFRTLTARANNIKAGNLYDPENAESLSDVETTLSGLGIALRSTDDEFRAMSDVLDEVAGKWDDFTSVQQRAIAVAFAGTRQQEKFLVLMENYDDALSYTSVAANAAGTATQKYEAYLDSIGAKTEAFQAQFQDLSSVVFDSDLIKGTVDTGTGLLSWLTKLIETIGIIPTLTGAAGLGAFVKNIGQPKLTGCDWAYPPLEEAS